MTGPPIARGWRAHKSGRYREGTIKRFDETRKSKFETRRDLRVSIEVSAFTLEHSIEAFEILERRLDANGTRRLIQKTRSLTA